MISLPVPIIYYLFLSPFSARFNIYFFAIRACGINRCVSVLILQKYIYPRIVASNLFFLCSQTIYFMVFPVLCKLLLFTTQMSTPIRDKFSMQKVLPALFFLHIQVVSGAYSQKSNMQSGQKISSCASSG